MRHRHGVLGAEPELSAAHTTISRHIANVDFFAKPKDDYRREQTQWGAVVSLCTVCVITFLVLWEGIAYIRGRDAYDTDVSLDKGLSEDMPIHVDVLFPLLPCNRLSIDVVDSTGRKEFNYTGTIHKLPTALDGTVLYKGSLKELDNEIENRVPGTGSNCPPCPSSAFDGATAEVLSAAASKCCNTCESVLDLYKELGKGIPDTEYIPQCLEQLYERSSGCNVVGSLELKKVPVVLIFGPRRTGEYYSLKDVVRLDTSHLIRKLRIGDESVERFSKNGVAEPLSGHTSSSLDYSETRYLVKVVPTTYRKRKVRDAKASTYEYSAQWSRRSIVVGFAGAVPAVYFEFEPAAIQVNNIFERQPFSHFVVQLCGIAGGLFVVLGFIDGAVHWFLGFGKRWH